MPESKPTAFVSRRFVPNDVVDAICGILAPDIVCKPATDLKLRPIPQTILDRIRNADLLVAIITKGGDSCWIQNELGMAYALGKPILVFYEASVPTDGFAPMVSEYVTFDPKRLSVLIKDKERLIQGIQGAVAQGRVHQQEMNAFAEQRNLGVVGVYPDRKDAFLHFREHWDAERESIHIVASTLEGFLKFAGDPGHELIEDRIRNGCAVQVLLTHPAFLKFRARNENVKESWIRDQLSQTLDQLRSLADSGPGRLEVRCFKAAPTCFAIITTSHMLVNPYPYMRTAYSCFALVARKTSRGDDIYHVYHDYHFQRPWEESEPLADRAQTGTGKTKQRPNNEVHRISHPRRVRKR